MAASIYDISVSVTGRDIFLPDSPYYIGHGQYINTVLHGFDEKKMKVYAMRLNPPTQEMFIGGIGLLEKERFRYSVRNSQDAIVYIFIIGALYYMFGPVGIIIRIFNIFLCVVSVYFIFRIAKRKFGDLAANLFLLIALFLPTLFGYSIMICRDFLRVFMVAGMLYIIYGGVIWGRVKKG